MKAIKHSILSLSIAGALLTSLNSAMAYTLEYDKNRLTQADLLGESGSALALIGDNKNSNGYIETRPITTHIYADGSVRRAYSTQLNYNQKLGNQSMHFLGEVNTEQSNINVGVSLGKTTLTVDQGQGNENAWLSSNYLSGNDYFKQGFNPAKYHYRAVNLQQQLSDSLSINASNIDIQLDGRVDPSVQTLGVNWKGFSANALNTQRNGFSIAKGLTLAYQNDNFRSSFEQYRNANGYDIKSLRLKLNNDKRGSSYGLELSSSDGAFNGRADNRMMLTYTKRWGQDHYSLSAAEAVAHAGGFGATTAVVAGVGAAALIGAAAGSSSGGGDGGSGGFSAQHDAAYDVLNRINPTSVKENKEYGGWIVQAGDGTYSSTPPVRGDAASVNIGPKPNGGTASYHTHAAYDPNYDNENFSPQDLESDRFFGVDGYLGTPAGQFKYHNVTSGEVTTLGTIAN